MLRQNRPRQAGNALSRCHTARNAGFRHLPWVFLNLCCRNGATTRPETPPHRGPPTPPGWAVARGLNLCCRLIRPSSTQIGNDPHRLRKTRFSASREPTRPASCPRSSAHAGATWWSPFVDNPSGYLRPAGINKYTLPTTPILLPEHSAKPFRRTVTNSRVPA